MPSERAFYSYSNIHFYRKSLRYSCRQGLGAITRPVISRQLYNTLFILS